MRHVRVRLGVRVPCGRKGMADGKSSSWIHRMFDSGSRARLRCHSRRRGPVGGHERVAQREGLPWLYVGRPVGTDGLERDMNIFLRPLQRRAKTYLLTVLRRIMRRPSSWKAFYLTK